MSNLSVVPSQGAVEPASSALGEAGSRPSPSSAGETAALSLVTRDLTKMGRLVLAQLEAALDCFRRQDLALADEIVERDDVVDNLNLSLEERCFDLAATGTLDRWQLRTVRATVKVASNLERIGDAGTHIAKRVRLIHLDGVSPTPFDIDGIGKLALQAVEEAVQSFLLQDEDLARSACMREPELDALYVSHLEELRARLGVSPDDAHFLLHLNSVLKYLEKVADYTLNIGEQTIFLVTGRRLKFSQYQQLDRLMVGSAAGSVGFSPYWDGISGALVARLEGNDVPVIYKEGSRRKIQEEIDKLEAWQRIAAQHIPKVLGSVSLKDRQALLREFVEGTVLSELYRSTADLRSKLHATEKLLEAVEFVWSTTLTATAPKVNYVQQIRRRLPDIVALHPELAGVLEGEGSAGRPGLGRLLDLAGAIEPEIAPPFSVWLHGDFNANNVVYHPVREEIKFVDVHRSELGDLLQDIGVFLLSMDRRSDVSIPARSDLMVINRRVEEFARHFAEAHGDSNFHRRLLLSSARAHVTSARVVIEPALASSLVARGIGLLSQFVG